MAYRKRGLKLIITNLKKKLGDLTIDIEKLEFEKGKVHGLLGGNGCGKSTLSKILIGAIALDKGQVHLEGISSDSVTLMSQRPYMLQRTVLENIIYPLQIRKMEIDYDEIDQWLKKINLYHKRDQYARSLSSGEQQKVSFLRSLIFKPEFVIIDETLSNLDPESLKLFEDWILDWQKEHKITWLIISHQLIQINNLCEKVHFMKKGQILMSGDKDEVLYESENEDIKQFVQYQIIRAKNQIV